MTTTIITCPIPDNINPLSPNGFMFNITKLPNLAFFCQSVNIPGITLGAPEFVNPFNVQPIPGETLTYDQLQVQFLVDSNMLNYKSIYNWIIALGFPQSYDQYITYNDEDNLNYSELAKNYSDATLSILGPNNVTVQNIQFTDMFPIAIDSLQFASTNTDVQYLIGNATFRYGYYKFL
jgi:hypothetical protein